MLTKLLALFPNAILHQQMPSQPSANFYFFFDQYNKNWLSIPKSDISERELELLKTLYEIYEPLPSDKSINMLNQETLWRNFLFFQGKPPEGTSDSYLRAIQFQLNGSEIDKMEFESALRGFFSEKDLIIWEKENAGVIIEKKQKRSMSLTEKELVSLINTMESDFFVRISIYNGKQYPFTQEFPEIFQEEREFFAFALDKFGKGMVFSFERVFPVYVACQLPQKLIDKINKEFFDVYQEDHEIFSTVKAFLENNLNASSTAKKLYIHRNTLQYRLDKFSEKTGIQLKDFHSAFTVFLACLVFDFGD